MNTSLSRKRFLQGSAAAVAAAFVTPQAALANTAASASSRAMPLTQTWDKTFPKSAKVDHRKVTFKNRYGISLAADLYMPVGGEIIEVNEALRADPSLANTDPLGNGWFFTVHVTDMAEFDQLMDPPAYDALLKTL